MALNTNQNGYQVKLPILLIKIGKYSNYNKGLKLKSPDLMKFIINYN